MTDDSSDTSVLELNVEGIGGGNQLSKDTESTQLSDRRFQTYGFGIKPPYNPDRLASYLELNETHATAVRKKARWEVGYGFDIVAVDDVDPDDASEEEKETAVEFWRGRDSTWQTGPDRSAEPTTPEEVKELARQDYHAIGWACLEILVDMEGEPVGLAHVPANTVRVREPQASFDQPRHPENGDFIDSDAAEIASRGYVQKRHGQKVYFGEAGDRYRDTPIFVDKETGEVARGSAENLDNEPANELIFIRNPSPLEQDYGIPDWVSAIRTLTADEAAKDYNREFFANDTIPRMVVKVTGGELSEESKNDLEQMLHGLREESHRAVVLEVEKFQQGLDDDVEISLEPMGQGISEEMDFRQFREKNEHEIAKVHEVPPILIGVTSTSNRSNSEEQVADFANNVIAPEQHKFAERLYQIVHQQALGIEDWTIEYELRGADQPSEDAKIAEKKIRAVRGAIPINRALEMIGEDPLPEDHPVSGDTLVADVGSDTQPVGGDPNGQPERVDAAPPPENKVGERDWAFVREELAEKEIESTGFNSSNLAEGLYDYEDQELYLSFRREDGPRSLYAYVDVPPTEWSGLTNASSHGSYHYDSIRLEYPYVEITNFHERLPEGETPEDPPEDVPLTAPTEGD